MRAEHVVRAPRACAAVSVHAEVAADVPVGEEREFAREQRLVVGRQLAFARRALPADQRVDRVEVEPVRATSRRAPRGRCVCRGRSAAGSRGRGPAASTGGAWTPAAREQRGDVDERRAVLHRRRRVHRRSASRAPASACGASGVDAEVAAEARVGRRRRDRERVRAERRASRRRAVEAASAGKAAAGESSAGGAASAAVGQRAGRRRRRADAPPAR